MSEIMAAVVLGFFGLVVAVVAMFLKVHLVSRLKTPKKHIEIELDPHSGISSSDEV